MRTYVFPIAVLCLAGVAPAARAQQAGVPAQLALDEAWRLARANNPMLSAERQMVEMAQADRLGASLRPNPAVTVESEGYPLFDAPRPSFFNGQEFTLRFDQEIELAGRRRLRTETAEAGVTVARAFVADAERRLRLDVQRAYFEAVLAKADRDAARAALDEISRVIELSRARVRQGESSGAELRRLEVERLRFVDDVFNDELAYQNARSALLALIGASDLAQDFDVVEPLAAPDDLRQRYDVAATGALPAAVPAPLQTEALTNRADLLAARGEVQRLDTETRLQRALRTPNITVGGGYRRDLGTNAVVFGVTVPLPLFNRNQGGVTRAEAERRRAQALAQATEIDVRLDVQRAANAVAINRARVAYIEGEYLANAQQSRDIVLASYRLGAADLIDFLDAQRAFRDVQRTYNRALFDERLSLFALEAAVGGPGAPAGRSQNQE